MKSSLLTTLLLVSAASSGLAQQLRQGAPSRFLAPPTNHPGTSIVKNAYMVELSQEPDTDAVSPQQDRFRQELRRRNIPFDERFSFSVTLNAISLELDSTNIDLVANMTDVKQVWPLRKVLAPRVETSNFVQDKGLPFSHTMTGVDVLHTKHNLTGHGLNVGVIDTGIDYLHPGLGGCFGPNCRVFAGWDFVGDDYTGGKSLPVPDGDPRDTCAGHGTHVAGIIGANDATFVGVAPSVSFGAYRVFGCKGSTENDIIIASLERALKDKMDIVNLSLGGDSSWGESSDAIVAERLARRGLIVVAAMGNSATKGLWEASSPAIAPSAFSVASLDNIKYLAYTISLASAPTKQFPYTNSKDGIGQCYRVRCGNNNDACKPATIDLKDKVVLIKRGTCTFTEKALNAQKAGAVGVIVYNNVFGSITPGADDPAITIPAQIVFSPEQVSFENPTGGRLSDFSSWGPGPRVEMKPDIGAQAGKYATLSGTSMATPYMAGSIALYLEANKKAKPNMAVLHRIFQNTARPTTEVKADKQGIFGTTVVNPSRIALNDTEHANSHPQTLSITNNGNRARDYYITHRASVSVRGLDDSGVALPVPEMNDAAATVNFSLTRLRIAAGKTSKITSALGLFRLHYHQSGTTADAAVTNDAIHVPYLGMKGNLRDLHVMKTSGELPLFQNIRTNKTISRPEETTTYTVANNDFPELVYRIEYPTRKVQARIYDATTKKVLGLIPGSLIEWAGRNDNSADNTASVVQWPGTVVTLDAKKRTSDLPDGSYYVEMMALRPYGKEHRDADYDIWRSPTVTFKRASNTKIATALW
ncbi:peptidase S8/S53 domain-containing protein [Syncephalis plumigaleata]|nr:peptidase S8/S53 domain-containing protein [Syncephalis plumigaleata]